MEIPKIGVIGYHPSALPANRGRHPIIWAIALGLNETASTFFFMDECADSGDVLSQAIISIEDSDDPRSLYTKVILSAMNQIEEFMPSLLNNTYSRIK